MLANAQTALGSARRELALAELECRVIDQCIRGLSTSNTCVGGGKGEETNC